jgi:hypothetical protein
MAPSEWQDRPERCLAWLAYQRQSAAERTQSTKADIRLHHESGQKKLFLRVCEGNFLLAPRRTWRSQGVAPANMT